VEIDGTFASLVSAAGVSSFVFVVVLLFKGSADDVLHGFLGPSTFTTVAGLGAVNELLLRETGKDAVLDLVETLDGSGGRKGPA